MSNGIIHTDAPDAPDAPQRPQVREVKVYLSEGLYKLVQAEIGLCSCTQTGFIRHAIASEIVRRTRLRNMANPGEIIDGALALDVTVGT